MNKYQNGKIYIITGSETDKVYLGSTIVTLKYRLSSHKNKKDCSSKEILSDKEYNICLLESYPCNNKNELLWRERYWFDELKSILVNNYRPIITKEENEEVKNKNKKEWNEKNKEKLKETRKEYYNENKKLIKEYRKNNKENIKKYNNNNKAKIKKKTQFINSWGGGPRNNNNLLKISIDVFK